MTPIDPQTLGRWFDAHAASMVLYARQWLAADLAEDVVQEVFIRLAAQQRTPENIRAWLLTSVRHAALDMLKHARRRKARDLSAVEQRAALFSTPSGDPLEAAEAQDALAALPAPEREVLTLRIWAQATFPEIAAITATPLSTVFNTYRAGLERLKARWESPCSKT